MCIPMEGYAREDWGVRRGLDKMVMFGTLTSKVGGAEVCNWHFTGWCRDRWIVEYHRKPI